MQAMTPIDKKQIRYAVRVSQWVTMDGLILEAETPEGLIEVMRESSWVPGATLKDFVRDAAGRARAMGHSVRGTGPLVFLDDLIAAGLLQRVEECAWCGADIEPDERAYPNRRGEVFCSDWHRRASNAALRRLMDRS